MPEIAETQQVKRGPGRPRKVAVPKVEDAPSGEGKTTDPVMQLDDVDRARIGQEVDPTGTHIGFDDGRQYLCENGEIVERIH